MIAMSDAPMSRRSFQLGLAAGGLAFGAASIVEAQEKPARPAADTGDAKKEIVAEAVVPTPERDYPAPGFKPRFRKPQTGGILVQDFVIYSHFDLEMVEYLLRRDASLVNATMDWGGGDWESGLGAAAHIGRPDIAEFLIDRGARLDIFAAAMLGHLDVVKSLLTAHPQLFYARGPHGIPLLSHAKAGKERSAETLAFLQEFQKTAPKPVVPPPAPPMMPAAAGGSTNTSTAPAK
jgi:hypothetical protein